MCTAAGSLVKALVIAYPVAQGDASLVAWLARALGFQTVTDDMLEARQA